MFVKVTDNVLSNKEIKDLYSLMVDTNRMPWYYRATSSYLDRPQNDTLKYEGGLVHVFLMDGKDNSEFAPYIRRIINDACQAAGMKVNYLHRAKANLNTINPKPLIHMPHTDFPYSPKYTGIIYVDDSDGDTVIYNESFDMTSEKHSYDYCRDTYDFKLTVSQTIEPRANRLLCFNTNQYHSAASPVNHATRIVINFNFE